jgi:hypothetical protein
MSSSLMNDERIFTEQLNSGAAPVPPPHPQNAPSGPNSGSRSNF